MARCRSSLLFIIFIVFSFQAYGQLSTNSRPIHIFHPLENALLGKLSTYNAANACILYQSAFDADIDGKFDGITPAFVAKVNLCPSNFTGPMVLYWDQMSGVASGFYGNLSGKNGKAAQAAALVEAIKVLNAVKSLRPNVQVGFYGIPFANTFSTKITLPSWYVNQVTTLKTLADASDALFPSMEQNYKIGVDVSLANDQLAMKNHAEVSLRTAGNKPVYPFVWELYANPSKSYNKQLIPAAEFSQHLMGAISATFNYQRISGFYWWGASDGPNGLETSIVPIRQVLDSQPMNSPALTIVTGPTAANVNSASATIQWTVSAPSTGQVEYGLTTAYGNKSILISSLNTSLSATLSSLVASSVYHYRVISVDASGKKVVSSDKTFTTVQTPLTITGGPTSTNITNSGASIQWSVSASSSGQVEYGLTTAYGSSSALISTLATSFNVALSSLQPLTLYHYRVISTDGNGQKVTSADKIFTTSAPPLTITSGPSVSGITTSTAIIQWTLSAASSGQVQYGLTTAYGSTSALNSTLATSFSVALSSLQPLTLYHYRVTSTDANGQNVVSADMTFTTLASSLTITAGPTVSGTTSESISISWSVSAPSSGQVQYGLTTAYGNTSALISTLATSFTQSISGLKPSTIYHYRVTSIDANGQSVTSDDKTFTTNAFTITVQPATTSINATDVSIAWTLSDYGTGQIQYGLTTSYSTSSSYEGSFNYMTHAQTISGLARGTLYHYRVLSKNKSGIQVTSTDQTFTTLP
jgi:hypothetical protein